MMEAVLLLVLGVAAYRITRFLIEDSLIGMGMGQELQGGKFVNVPNSPMAARLDGFAYNPDGSDRNWFRGRVGDLLSCSWCLGAWVSFSAYALWTWTLPWQEGVEFQKWWIYAFAVAGVQGFISSRADA